jgi:signal transduction histidine kinase
MIASFLSYILAGYTLRPIHQTLAAQKNFVENASHELRTPLTVIKSAAEVLLRDPSPTTAATQKTLSSIVEEVDRMTEMSKELLFLARSGHSSSQKFSSINIVEIAERVVRVLYDYVTENSVSLVLNTKSAIEIIGNQAEIERMFFNLIHNAIEHTPRDGNVEVSISKEAHDVCILIRDTGEGIEELHIPHIFERFYKGVHSKGTGLGLSIVHDIVLRHNGSIAVNSILGQGTEVRVFFPLVS